MILIPIPFIEITDADKLYDFTLFKIIKAKTSQFPLILLALYHNYDNPDYDKLVELKLTWYWLIYDKEVHGLMGVKEELGTVYIKELVLFEPNKTHEKIITFLSLYIDYTQRWRYLLRVKKDFKLKKYLKDTKFEMVGESNEFEYYLLEYWKVIKEWRLRKPKSDWAVTKFSHDFQLFYDLRGITDLEVLKLMENYLNSVFRYTRDLFP